LACAAQGPAGGTNGPQSFSAEGSGEQEERPGNDHHEIATIRRRAKGKEQSTKTGDRCAAQIPGRCAAATAAPQRWLPDDRNRPRGHQHALAIDWPSKDIFHEYALDYAKKVNDMTAADSGSRCAGGSVVRLRATRSVSKGTLDAARRARLPYGKQNALALWGSSPCYAMDANQCSPWHKYGGGKELLNKLYASIGANVVSFRTVRCRRSRRLVQEPITSRKISRDEVRTVGISIDLFNGGAAVNALPGARDRSGDRPRRSTSRSSTTRPPTHPRLP